MNNNEILIRIKDSLDIETPKMVEIFKLGGAEVSIEDVGNFLIGSSEDEDVEIEVVGCNNEELESFLNGLIIFKRGVKESEPGKPQKPALAIKNDRSVNNVVLKKMKIALSLSGDDVIKIFKEAGVEITSRELNPLFRKEGHKHYKKCNDTMAVAFLNGITIKK